MNPIANKIVEIVNDHSGGIKYTELITEMAEWFYKVDNPTERIIKAEDIPEIVMNNILLECSMVLGVLEYSTIQNRSKFFIYRKG